MKPLYIAPSASSRKAAMRWLAFLVCVTTVFLTGTGRVLGQAKGIDDTWQGTLHLPQRDLRIVLKVARGDNGARAGTMYSIDQGGQAIKTSSLSFQD